MNNEGFCDLVPADVNAIALFQDQWSSILPNSAGVEGPGRIPLFEDNRISWLLAELVDIRGWTVLELGPLEGGHTFQLEKAGSFVTAIEANTSAFIKCLVVKNIMGMQSHFLLGDFSKSLGSRRRYDLLVAAGVLYHMTDPITLLSQMSDVSDNIYLWTHYYEEDHSKWHPSLVEMIGTKWLPDRAKSQRFNGLNVRLVPQLYGDALTWSGFTGGTADYSYWFYREDLFNVLGVLGYTTISVSFDDPQHPNGPAINILARRQ